MRRGKAGEPGKVRLVLLKSQPRRQPLGRQNSFPLRRSRLQSGTKEIANMHRLHGFRHHCGGGWGGFGWFIPALILGELISNRAPRQPEWPYPPPANPGPQEPQRQTADATAQTKTTVLCQKCNQRVNPEFAFCPHCGTRLAPPTCGYCGQTLERGATYCTKCGGPYRPEES